jgi:hypothetical protein
MRLHEADTNGVLWGSLRLENTSKDSLVLDSISFSYNPQHLRQLTEPYIWDDQRVKALGYASVEAAPLPLPQELQVPPKHYVRGYTLKPAGSADSDEPEKSEGVSSPDAEVVFEFASPATPSTVGDVVVRYRIGLMAYQKTFQIRLTICPPQQWGPCQQ